MTAKPFTSLRQVYNVARKGPVPFDRVEAIFQKLLKTASSGLAEDRDAAAESVLALLPNVYPQYEAFHQAKSWMPDEHLKRLYDMAADFIRTTDEIRDSFRTRAAVQTVWMRNKNGEALTKILSVAMDFIDHIDEQKDRGDKQYMASQVRQLAAPGSAPHTAALQKLFEIYKNALPKDTHPQQRYRELSDIHYEAPEGSTLKQEAFYCAFEALKDESESIRSSHAVWFYKNTDDPKIKEKALEIAFDSLPHASTYDLSEYAMKIADAVPEGADKQRAVAFAAEHIHHVGEQDRYQIAMQIYEASTQRKVQHIALRGALDAIEKLPEDQHKEAYATVHRESAKFKDIRKDVQIITANIQKAFEAALLVEQEKEAERIKAEKPDPMLHSFAGKMRELSL